MVPQVLLYRCPEWRNSSTSVILYTHLGLSELPAKTSPTSRVRAIQVQLISCLQVSSIWTRPHSRHFDISLRKVHVVLWVVRWYHHCCLLFTIVAIYFICCFGGFCFICVLLHAAFAFWKTYRLDHPYEFVIIQQFLSWKGVFTHELSMTIHCTDE